VPLHLRRIERIDGCVITAIKMDAQSALAGRASGKRQDPAAVHACDTIRLHLNREPHLIMSSKTLSIFAGALLALTLAAATLESCGGSNNGSSSGLGGSDGGLVGTGGANGAAGASGSGGHATGTGGSSSGTGGSTGASGCSACVKAAACCPGAAAAAGQPTSYCSQVPSLATCDGADAATQTTYVTDCTEIVQLGAALKVAACN
jgi:hypothetical protein